MPVLVFSSTNIGVILKYLSTIFLIVVERSGTTEAIITASISLTLVTADFTASRKKIPYSSAVLC